MSRPKTVGIVTTSFPRSAGDFAGRFVFELARGFTRGGYRVEVVVPEPSTPYHWSMDADWLEGIRVYPAPYFRPTGYQRLFFDAGVPDNIRRHPALIGLVPPGVLSLVHLVFRLRHRWDAVMSHWLLPSALVAGWGRRSGVRHLAVAHSGDVHLLTKPMLRHLSSALYLSADRFGFISETLRRRFLDALPADAANRFRARSLVTPMGIHVDDMRGAAQRQTLRDEWGLKLFTLLFLGRLVPIKGVSLLLEAAVGLRDVEILIAGDGPCRGELADSAAKLDIGVRFMGAVSPEERGTLLTACDALVLPSRTLPGGRCEGLPLVLSEAMAAGLPVIAADTGAVRELISHGENGWVFSEGSALELREAIVSLQRDEGLRCAFRRGGLKTVESRDWRRLLPVFESALFS